MNMAAVNVLMIEDSPFAQRTATKIFTQLNCQIHIVPLATQGLEQLLAGEYDIIFIDILLPDVDGLILADTIRHLINQRAKNIPLIAVTASPLAELKIKAEAVGCNDFLSKPLTIDSVRGILLKHLNQDKASRVES
jgi:CheY-like chemotaxis protein